MEMYVHSLKTCEGVHVSAEVTVLQRTSDGKLIVDYKGTKCMAIYNPFAGIYFADDIYSVIND